MNTYRSLATIQAVQYQGEPIPDVTCDGDRDKYGCDGSRAHLPHVHTMATGGLSVLKEGFWIVPEQGGPFAVYDDVMFRSHYEVPEEVEAVALVEVAALVEVPVPVEVSASVEVPVPVEVPAEPVAPVEVPAVVADAVVADAPAAVEATPTEVTPEETTPEEATPTEATPTE